MREIGLAHLYAQQDEHDEAYMVGDDEALFDIACGILEALRDRVAVKVPLMVRDGEAFSLVIVPLEPSESGIQNPELERLALPYTGRAELIDGVGPWEHPEVREMRGREEMG